MAERTKTFAKGVVTPRTSKRFRMHYLAPYLLLLPSILLLVIWVYWPLVQTAVLSFYEWNLLPSRPKVFVGWDNYVRILSLPEMGRALQNTLIYVVGLLPFSVFLPLALAIFVSGIVGRMRNIYRVIVFIPVIIAPVVVAVIWRWMLNPSQGILNRGLLGLFEIDPFNFFTDPATAIWAIIGITGWKLLGFSFLLCSAGLTNISREYYDAANVDGASNWQVVRSITLPLMTPTISFLVMMTILLGAQWVFPLINVLTQGGPISSTTNIYYTLWQYGFRNFNIGWSASAAVLFFIAFGILAWLLIKVMDRYSIYES